LIDWVVSVLEQQACGNVVHAVNSDMAIDYWLIE
jgi:hypothetical protein